MISIKICMFPGESREFTAENNASVAQIIELAALNASGYEVRVNGATATTATALNDGDRILLVKQVKGNVKSVSTCVFPGEARSWNVEDGATIQEVITLAAINVSGYEVRVNGAASTLASTVNDGDRILFVKQVKGNIAE